MNVFEEGTVQGRTQGAGNRHGSKEVSLKRQIGSCLFREATTKTEVGPSSVSRTSVANRRRVDVQSRECAKRTIHVA